MKQFITFYLAIMVMSCSNSGLDNERIDRYMDEQDPSPPTIESYFSGRLMYDGNPLQSDNIALYFNGLENKFVEFNTKSDGTYRFNLRTIFGGVTKIYKKGKYDVSFSIPSTGRSMAYAAFGELYLDFQSNISVDDLELKATSNCQFQVKYPSNTTEYLIKHTWSGSALANAFSQNGTMSHSMDQLTSTATVTFSCLSNSSDGLALVTFKFYGSDDNIEDSVKFELMDTHVFTNPTGELGISNTDVLSTPIDLTTYSFSND